MKPSQDSLIDDEELIELFKQMNGKGSEDGGAVPRERGGQTNKKLYSLHTTQSEGSEHSSISGIDLGALFGHNNQSDDVSNPFSHLSSADSGGGGGGIGTNTDEHTEIDSKRREIDFENDFGNIIFKDTQQKDGNVTPEEQIERLTALGKKYEGYAQQDLLDIEHYERLNKSKKDAKSLSRRKMTMVVDSGDEDE
jgi:hypothetical protein